ncbi:uncharacterized protein LOC144048393 [Vanacampus margaritifer]
MAVMQTVSVPVSNDSPQKHGNMSVLQQLHQAQVLRSQQWQIPSKLFSMSLASALPNKGRQESKTCCFSPHWLQAKHLSLTSKTSRMRCCPSDKICPLFPRLGESLERRGPWNPIHPAEIFMLKA